MNKYLEKIAELGEEDRNILGAGSLIGGTGLAASAASNKGIYEATGRHTYYHGTRKDIAENIKKEGLKPRGSKGVIDAVDTINKGFSGENEGLAFAHKIKRRAAVYADQAEKIKARGESYLHGLGRAADSARAEAGLGEGEVITIRAPKEHLYKNKVVNPEYKNMNPFQKLMLGGEHAVRREFEDNVLTHKGRIGAEHIKESPHYKGVTANEILEHVKKNPGKAARFGGRIVGGVGLAGLGVSLLRKKNEQVS